ncbi:polyprenyl synthetase family protein [Streptomyces sp. GC420]|uniref:polyprenyl synthetase family protein n=1 Tax=Streptomyces sp. GC420 TaxID=2697568 RepID=UPI001414D60F|nr:polyprenyl synthetase family protein [Streptomyces sp. GC420]NBM17240.1 hypothetical protein [Streptomyces sp. GC420]
MTRSAASAGLADPDVCAGVDRLLRTPAYGVLAAHTGAAAVREDMLACLGDIGGAVRACPLVIPPELADVLSGGKRLRPLLVLAAARAARERSAPPRERVVGGASAVELLHLASLVHDDIMDEAVTRHGVTTISARAGKNRALLAGDYLLGHAHAAAAALGTEAVRLLGRTLVRLCEGQAEECSTVFDVDRTERSYFSVIAGKTGSLIETSCRMGALAAGHDAATTAALGRFGHHLGIAFQLLDDLLDLTESGEALGKPVGHDIANGVYTHPTLWALRRDPQLRRLLLELARCEGPRSGLADEASRRVRESGALDATWRAVTRQRRHCLDSLGDAVGGIGPDGLDLMAELAVTVLGAAAPAPVTSATSGPLGGRHPHRTTPAPRHDILTGVAEPAALQAGALVEQASAHRD